MPIFLKIKLIIINLMNNYFKNINEYFRKLLINKILIKKLNKMIIFNNV